MKLDQRIVFFGTIVSVVLAAGAAFAQTTQAPVQKNTKATKSQTQQVYCDQRGCRDVPPGCKIAERKPGASRTVIGDLIECN